VSANVRLASLAVSLFALAAALLGSVGGPRRAYRDANDVPAVEVTTEHDGERRTIRLPVPVTIGRASTASIAIPDARVSRMHARIEHVAGAIGIRDLGSRNGTLLNARPLEEPMPLAPGDEIDVGTMHIIYRGRRSWT